MTTRYHLRAECCIKTCSLLQVLLLQASSLRHSDVPEASLGGILNALTSRKTASVCSKSVSSSRAIFAPDLLAHDPDVQTASPACEGVLKNYLLDSIIGRLELQVHKTLLQDLCSLGAPKRQNAASRKAL